jgi:hypothetical protein
MVTSVAASIFDLPQYQCFKDTDLFLSAKHLFYSYALIITLAVLFSKTPIALTSRVSPSVDLAVVTRHISPTIILTSSTSLTTTHSRSIRATLSCGHLDVITDVLR